MTDPTLQTLMLQMLNPGWDSHQSVAHFRGFTHQDWDGFLTLLRQHRLMAVIYDKLKGLAGSPHLPDFAFEQLHHAYLFNAVRNTLFLHEAKTILSTLNQAGMPVIGLKGLFLLENIYTNISLRGMADIDLLLKKPDIPRALDLLAGLGYQLTTYFNFNDENRDIKHVPPLNKQDGPYLEVHWTLIEEHEPFNIAIPGLWARAVPAKLAGVDAYALSPEDLLLHLCLHLGYQHSFDNGLRGLYDIAAVLRVSAEQLDWPRLVETARTWGSQRVTRLTLSLVRDLLGTPLPPQALEALQPAPPHWVLDQARTQILTPDQHGDVITPDLAKLATQSGVINRLRLIIQRVFVPRHTLARLYNVPPTSWRIYGCYFRRLADLMRGYRTTVKHIFQHNTGTLDRVANQQAAGRLRTWLAGDHGTNCRS